MCELISLTLSDDDSVAAAYSAEEAFAWTGFCVHDIIERQCKLTPLAMRHWSIEFMNVPIHLLLQRCGPDPTQAEKR